MSLHRIVARIALLGVGIAAACLPDRSSVTAPRQRAASRPALAQTAPLGPVAVGSAVDAGDFVVEFSGSPADLAAAVAAVGGTLERVHPELGLAKVTGLTDATAAALASAAGVQAATRDLLVQWIPPVAPSVAVLDAESDALPAAQGDPSRRRSCPCSSGTCG